MQAKKPGRGRKKARRCWNLRLQVGLRVGFVIRSEPRNRTSRQNVPFGITTAWPVCGIVDAANTFGYTGQDKDTPVYRKPVGRHSRFTLAGQGGLVEAEGVPSLGLHHHGIYV